MGMGRPQGNMPSLQMLQKHNIMIRCGGIPDGLYLTLYSMGVRGTGAMWHIIQERLNNATACATWNGARGPAVVLEEGLRQHKGVRLAQCYIASSLTVSWPRGLWTHQSLSMLKGQCHPCMHKDSRGGPSRGRGSCVQHRGELSWPCCTWMIPY